VISSQIAFRGVIIGAFSLAAVGVPLGFALADPPAAEPIACPGTISMPISNVGVPVQDTCNMGPMAPPVSGGAPSQQTLSNCGNVPGCLSHVLYGPGNVVVPDRDTGVRQSQ
jgi:hypothetical protein